MIHQTRWFLASMLAVGLTATVATQAALLAQEPGPFRAHLSLVPVDGQGARLTSGVGEAMATLDGTSVVISGTYSHLLSPANRAELLDAAPGFRGTAFAEVVIDGDRDGSFEWRVELSANQLRSLREGSVYLQIYTETNTDGAIRGWFRPMGA